MEGKRRLCPRAAARPLLHARSWWARQELAAKANQQNSHQEPSEGWGDSAVCVQNVPRAPLLAFQPPHLSPFACWALARCPSHVSAWETPPAFSFNAAESRAAGFMGLPRGCPSMASSPHAAPQNLLRFWCVPIAGHSSTGPSCAPAASWAREHRLSPAAWSPAGSGPALPPVPSRVQSAGLGCSLVA